MDRYVAMELAMPFLFGVCAFSGVGLAIGTLFDLVQKVTESGLPLLSALQVFLFQMPSFVVLAFPMSTLLATLIVYGRLSGDSEITALRGCGVSIRRLVLPAIVLSLVVTGTTFMFNELVVPITNYQASAILDHALDQNRPSFQEKNIFYREFTGDELSRVFYARRFDGQRMQGLMVLDFTKGSLRQILAAEQATWSNKHLWNFLNGTIYDVAGDGSYQSILNFERHSLELSRVPLDLAIENRQSEQMNIAEAQQHLKLLKQSGDQREIRKLRLRIQEKYALPPVCIVFGLVGAALGTRPQRASPVTGFGISVVIIFSYYLLAFISSSLGEAGVFDPFVSAW
ncbi:LptF/LptG family permease, partial [Nostoc sp.]|uniref:LptF/LptG family permease n=1 Tax=Nostoc sp. TaxID=1180 RepID=UPI003593421E